MDEAKVYIPMDNIDKFIWNSTVLYHYFVRNHFIIGNDGVIVVSYVELRCGRSLEELLKVGNKTCLFTDSPEFIGREMMDMNFK